jgi:hypothetical protein
MQDPIDRNRPPGSRRAPRLTAVLLVTAATTVAACGSSSPTSPSSPTSLSSPTSSSATTIVGSEASSSTVAFSGCMRSHGVPTFPDLKDNRMQIQASGQAISVNGVSINAPAFRSALQTCEKYRPHIESTPAQTARYEQEALNFARCMRGHGIKNFPDPPPSTGTGTNHVVNLTHSGLNFYSPAFQAAANACGGFGSVKGS